LKPTPALQYLSSQEVESSPVQVLRAVAAEQAHDRRDLLVETDADAFLRSTSPLLARNQSGSGLPAARTA
jgi:hypothetical protein